MEDREIRQVLSAYCQLVIEQLIGYINEDEKSEPGTAYRYLRPTEQEDAINQLKELMEEI